MKIKYSHAAGITATVPLQDGLANYAFAINTPERRNVWHKSATCPAPKLRQSSRTLRTCNP